LVHAANASGSSKSLQNVCVDVEQNDAPDASGGFVPASIDPSLGAESRIAASTIAPAPPPAPPFAPPPPALVVTLLVAELEPPAALDVTVVEPVLAELLLPPAPVLVEAPPPPSAELSIENSEPPQCSRTHTAPSAPHREPPFPISPV
jgi:hypothetical protein